MLEDVYRMVRQRVVVHRREMPARQHHVEDRKPFESYSYELHTSTQIDSVSNDLLQHVQRYHLSVSFLGVGSGGYTVQ